MDIILELDKYNRLKTNITNNLLNEIEKQARLILSRNEHLDEFIMCMGFYFFTIKTSSFKNYVTNFEEIDVILNEYNYEFKLTSEGMRFSLNSKKITDF